MQLSLARSSSSARSFGVTAHNMTIKAERWDLHHCPDRRACRPSGKSVLLSFLSIYVLVLPVCLLASWFLGWTWLNPEERGSLSLFQVGSRLLWHSLLMTLQVLLGFWYLTVPAVWLNAIAISRRSVTYVRNPEQGGALNRSVQGTRRVTRR